MTFIVRGLSYLKWQLSENAKASNYNMLVVGLIGLFGHPAYWAWWTYVDPQPNENIWLRLIGAVICGLLLVNKFWPAQLARFLPIYYFFAVAYTLPFFFTYYLISSNYSMLWSMAETAMVLFSISVLPSFIIWLLNLIVGIIAAIICAYFLIPQFTPYFIYLDSSSLFYIYLPVFLFALSAGVAISYSNIRGIVTLKNIAIQARNKTLQALAGSIAHEIRNPLGQVKACLDGIERTLPVPTITDQMHPLTMQQLKELYEYIAMGQSAVKRGSQIISMTLIEVKSKAIDTSHFAYLPAAQTVQKAIAEYGYETVAERSKVKVKVVQDFIFQGEETLCIFVLFNLIKNALYYFKSNPEGRITITVSKPTITVHDTGPGIAADRLLHLFESFQTYGKQDGTGLGLSYCKRVMHAFGGDISCRSQVGEYTEFILHFPEVTQETWDAYQAAIIHKAYTVFAGQRILIVDNDEIVRLLTHEILSKLGAHIEQAENGQIALQKCADTTYDLIILDINMPVLDGYTTAEHIRAAKGNPNQHVPIVAYTTESAHMAQIKTQKTGMDGFISKPCEPLLLIQTLQQILTTAHQHKNKSVEQTLLPKFSGKTILIADDSELNRDILRHDLEKLQVNILEANNGLEVLEQLSLHPHCDAVLMDLRMPKMDGLQAAQEIRMQNTSYRTIPIIALTGDAELADDQAADSSGINDFIAKPVESATLYQVLLKYFDNSEQITQTAQKLAHTIASLSSDKMELNYTLLFDLERLEKFKQMNLLEKCAASFQRQSTEYLTKLTVAAQENDLAAVEDALHFLKGSSLTIGAKSFGEYVAEIYQEVLDGNWPSQKDWLTHIIELHTETIATLQTYSKNF
jgi:two-component system CAI-1 autoinducer sensor kinase/phosphatase CqsS